MTRDRLDHAFTDEDLAELAERGITLGVESAGPDAGSYWAQGPKGMRGKGRTPRLAVEDLFRAGPSSTRVSRCATCHDSWEAGVEVCPLCAGQMVQWDVPVVPGDADDEGMAAA